MEKLPIGQIHLELYHTSSLFSTEPYSQTGILHYTKFGHAAYFDKDNSIVISHQALFSGVETRNDGKE